MWATNTIRDTLVPCCEADFEFKRTSETTFVISFKGFLGEEL